jgi:hypothetical protein
MGEKFNFNTFTLPAGLDFGGLTKLITSNYSRASASSIPEKSNPAGKTQILKH